MPRELGPTLDALAKRVGVTNQSTNEAIQRRLENHWRAEPPNSALIAEIASFLKELEIEEAGPPASKDSWHDLGVQGDEEGAAGRRCARRSPRSTLLAHRQEEVKRVPAHALAPPLADVRHGAM